MMAWLILLLLIGGALGLARLAGLRGSWLTMAASALLVGAAGYALQGRPGLAGTSSADLAQPAPISLVRVRNAFFGQFNRSSSWLIIADSYAARGKTQDAAGLLGSAVRARPRDHVLWVGYGNALTDHARGLTPAARLAFARAAALAPDSPAPGYFLGLALLRSGDPDGALAQWRTVLARAPADASWRPYVEDGVALIERMRPGAEGPAR